MADDIYVLVEHVQGKVSEISYVMLACAREIAAETGATLTAILLGQGSQDLSASMAADRILYVDDPALAEFNPDAYQLAMAEMISSGSPRIVLFGDTTIGAEVAGVLSARMNLPLINHCSSMRVENGALRFVSRICGGKIMAEGDIPGPTALICMVPGDYKAEQGMSDQPASVETANAPTLADLRVALSQYIQPDVGDVDISTEPILIAVGRGIQQEANLELAEELAEALGGVLCASRPVVDQGWLPTSKLVGKSGKSVKPKVFLAIGISGAPEHVEGITGSETIIAVNTDPAAPIFDVAKYGANADLFELVPALTEQLSARG